MKTMLLAVGAVVSLSAFGVAYAGEGEAATSNSQFTQVAGVVAPVQSVRPMAMAGTTASPQYFFARSHRGTWLFPADETGGGN